MSCWLNESHLMHSWLLDQEDPKQMIHSLMKQGDFRIAVLAAGLVLAVLVSACASQEAVDPLEQQAQSLDREIMCPICPGESIAQSQVEFAQQMRTFVREKLAEGWTGEQIKQYYVERYGPRILLSPPRQGFYLVGWISPFVALLLGGGVVVYVLKRWMGRRQIRVDEVSQPVEELPDEYVQRLEEELAQFK
ncbi:MAG: cytochrome c-type biogenesis protein CcmH [Chloroflexi bacterium]|nr:MAG: cytochrome c-type biogenesis protein CcmH [Chloroflexota bacterium]